MKDSAYNIFSTDAMVSRWYSMLIPGASFGFLKRTRIGLEKS